MHKWMEEVGASCTRKGQDRCRGEQGGMHCMGLAWSGETLPQLHAGGAELLGEAGRPAAGRNKGLLIRGAAAAAAATLVDLEWKGLAA